MARPPVYSRICSCRDLGMPTPVKGSKQTLQIRSISVWSWF